MNFDNDKKCITSLKLTIKLYLPPSAHINDLHSKPE